LKDSDRRLGLKPGEYAGRGRHQSLKRVLICEFTVFRSDRVVLEGRWAWSCER
jgi:hypothetical protein